MIFHEQMVVERNCGWMNWRDAGTPAGTSGDVRPHVVSVGADLVREHRLGQPGRRHPGPWGRVRQRQRLGLGRQHHAGTEHLTGYAWGENVGWINFSGGAMALSANPARLEGGRLRGYAWGENIGWINLDNATHFVALECRADTNHDGILSPADFTAWIAAFNASAPECDQNGDGLCNPADFTAWIANFNAGCD